MFDTWSENNEQKCWADVHTRLSSCFVFIGLSFSITSDTTGILLFSWCVMARCKEHKQGGTLKTPPPTQIPSLAHPQNKKKWGKKQKIWYGHVIYTALTRFLDLNYKHTSIFQHVFFKPTVSLWISITYYSSKLSSRADSANPESGSLVKDMAVWLVSAKHLSH